MVIVRCWAFHELHFIKALDQLVKVSCSFHSTTMLNLCTYAVHVEIKANIIFAYWDLTQCDHLWVQGPRIHAWEGSVWGRQKKVCQAAEEAALWRQWWWWWCSAPGFCLCSLWQCSSPQKTKDNSLFRIRLICTPNIPKFSATRAVCSSRTDHKLCRNRRRKILRILWPPSCVWVPQSSQKLGSCRGFSDSGSIGWGLCLGLYLGDSVPRYRCGFVYFLHTIF